MITFAPSQKQIERAKVCLAKYEKNASMYDARATKAIERAKKATGSSCLFGSSIKEIVDALNLTGVVVIKKW